MRDELAAPVRSPRPSRSALGLSVLAAMVCAASAVRGQVAGGDGGVRPVTLTYSYTGELVQNASGGARRGATAAGAAGVQVTLRLTRLVGLPGARIFVFAIGTHGGAPSQLVGDVQGVSNLEAPGAVWLEEAWLQQSLFGNRLSWLIGRYDLNAEFYRLQSGALFINSSFGVARIRKHMREIAVAFAAGDFATPMLVHMQEVPGTRVMKERARMIQYTAHDLPRGAEVRLTTRDPEALAAIREFMEFQRRDHHSGGVNGQH